MSERHGVRERATVLAVIAALSSTGCARLVTVDRETIARRADPTWKIRKNPEAGATTEQASLSLPPTLVPFHARPEVAQALRSRPDGYGIPTDLYLVDPLLAAHKREMSSEASARHLAGTGVIVLGILAGALAGFNFWYASSHSDNPKASQLYLWSGVSGVLALGCLVSGIAVAARGSDSHLLENYYRETYSR